MSISISDANRTDRPRRVLVASYAPAGEHYTRSKYYAARNDVMTTSSAADGRFRIRLAPGTYVVQGLPRSGSPLPRPPGAMRVVVRRGHFASITITYDTGIR